MSSDRCSYICKTAFILPPSYAIPLLEVIILQQMHGGIRLVVQIIVQFSSDFTNVPTVNSSS